jgi:uncharacterized protein YjiS (DUF1127 family)
LSHASRAWLRRGKLPFAAQQCTLFLWQFRTFRPAPARKGGSAMLRSIFRFLRSWRRYNISLRQLSHLDDHQLADIGISRSDIPRVAWDRADH